MQDVASAIALLKLHYTWTQSSFSSPCAQQPSWSDLPVLVLTMGGKETFQSRRQEWARRSLGDVTLLERPIRTATLLSSVTVALHTRSRQYERRLSETILRQSEKLAAVGRLASSIAHEINNPLEAVTNLLYLLEGTQLNRAAARIPDNSSTGVGAGLRNCLPDVNPQPPAGHQRISIHLCAVGFGLGALSRTDCWLEH